jgi:hypothetical protein
MQKGQKRALHLVGRLARDGDSSGGATRTADHLIQLLRERRPHASAAMDGSGGRIQPHELANHLERVIVGAPNEHTIRRALACTSHSIDGACAIAFTFLPMSRTVLTHTHTCIHRNKAYTPSPLRRSTHTLAMAEAVSASLDTAVDDAKGNLDRTLRSFWYNGFSPSTSCHVEVAAQ